MGHRKKSEQSNMYRIHQIKLKIGESREMIPEKIAKTLRIRENRIREWKIVRESVDARDKKDIRLVYSVDFDADLDISRVKNPRARIEEAPDLEYRFPAAEYPKDRKIAVVGFGPCGMFAALSLAQNGYRPVVFERGRKVDERSRDVEKFWNEGILNSESNVQFGEGGAGTFSDGKLTTGIKDIRIRKVLEELHAFGAPDDILYKQKPHIGTDVLKNVVKNLRKEVIRLGGEIRFQSRVDKIITDDGRITGLCISETDDEGKTAGQYEFSCDKAIFAMGHSARDLFRSLYGSGVSMKSKPFSIGVRIEHPQSMINRAQWGDEKIADILGAAEYKLNCRTGKGRGVYTFCMCPGGEVVMASSGEGQVVTNGMSYRARDGEYANSALLVDVRVEDFGSDHPLAGISFQEKYEQKAYNVHKGYRFPETVYGEFAGSDLASCLPDFASEAIMEAMPVLGRKLRGFDSPDAVMKGVETRSSSPVRFERDERCQSNIEGLYPGGEGAGYAGGIMSSAVDGIRLAEMVACGGADRQR